jgi:hypothetical protein
MQNIQENLKYESMRKNIQYVEILFCAVYCFQDNFRVKKVLAPSKSPIMCFARIKKLPPARLEIAMHKYS